MVIRLFGLGVTRSQSKVLSSIVTRAILTGVSSLANLLVVIHILGLPCHGSLFLAFLLLTSSCLAATVLGALMALASKQLMMALMTSLALSTVFSVISGVFFPLDSLPYYFKWCSIYLPAFYPVSAFRSILLRESPPFLSLILPGFIVNIIWFSVGLILCIYFFTPSK